MLPGGEQEVTLRDYVAIFLKNRWLVAAFAVVGTVATTAWTFSQTPIYRGTTTILIEQASIKVLSIEEVYRPATSWMGYYETQYKILKSRALAKRVFDTLDLYADPDYQKSVDPIGSFIGRVTVEPIEKSRLVLMSFDHPHPQKAAVLVNALAKAYVDQDVEMKLSSTRYAVEWLTKQLDEQKAKLGEGERTLQEFVEKNRIISVPGVEEETNKLLEELKRQQAALERQYAELSRRYKPKHPKMARLIEEAKSVRQRLEEEVQKTIDYNRLTVEYGALKREVQTSQELYGALLKRTKEASVAGELPVTNLRIVDAAEVPSRPIRPNHPRDLLFGLAASFALGLGTVFLKEYFDNTVKTSDEVEQYVMLPFLGYIPSGKAQDRSGEALDRLVQQDPSSIAAESYRTIRTGVVFSTIDRPIKTILVTSPLPQDGKSMFSTNFSTIMAQAHESVLLVEGDLRRPRLAQVFHKEGAPGLSQYLVEKRRLEDVIQDTDIPNLKVITAGAVPPNPAELLGSARMKEFLQEVAGRFERVIVDSPPVMSVTDAPLLAHEVDGVLCVVRSGKTPVEAVIRTKKQLLDAKAKILGIVVNDIMPRHEPYYYYYRYKYEHAEQPSGAQPAAPK